MSHLQIEIDESLRFPAATLKKIIRRKLDKLLSDELVPREDGASEARRVQLDKDAQLAFSAAATVFVSYITAISTAVGAERKRTTLNMDDVIEALRRTEFEDFAVEVEQFVQNWRMLNERRKAQARQARVERKRKEPENSDVENDDGAYASDMPQEDTEDPEEDDLIEGT
ncbi:probable DNA polymerase epsilon, subunit C [Cyanidioschyzon merolae strain 10D]|jgi:histone H3/H4|uniref:Probable DNA polymerase epsilon, subunit C n=1 Tax=Cyanidioschyzon merolae (strain NIES-3377 / 10D) TaxID=280699 RepID=M1VH22_CYAM1|nr:probable DNA polymerase epsilon, subunit C [Cyanidioschyzon merolae strain 10D]BAM82557.1 probable DNA polymerase epsilon, subunit C [Cyanidioschyzon merolae strain 10D]|eukprot:XP_005538593.1 probable DNA polymerase epsilon, subunit C [Cyanidioschyzon merolae strain 10D]